MVNVMIVILICPNSGVRQKKPQHLSENLSHLSPLSSFTLIIYQAISILPPKEFTSQLAQVAGHFQQHNIVLHVTVSAGKKSAWPPEAYYSSATLP